MSESSPLSRLIGRRASKNALDDGDPAALLALPHTIGAFTPNAYIVREGQPPRSTCSFVLSGFAFRQKQTPLGARQIGSLHMAGDILDFQHLFLQQADHNVQAMTRLETFEIDRGALQAIAIERPQLSRAMWIETAIEARSTANG